MVTNSETNENKTIPRQVVDLMVAAIVQAIDGYCLSHPNEKPFTRQMIFSQFVYPIETLIDPDPSVFNAVAQQIATRFNVDPNDIPPNHLKQIEVVESERPPETNILRDAAEELTRVMDFAQALPRTPTKETFSIDARHCHTSEGFEIVETVSIQVKTSN